LKKRLRLTRQSDFRRILSRNRIFVGRALIAFALSREGPPTRIGISTSRKLRGAVARNRARRRLREVARLVLLAADSPLQRRGIPYDVVLIARPAAVELPFTALEAEARALLDLLASPAR
jgi:ribonuclease P protein component